ncbi:MAG: SRPBCC domain-containing protein [Actinomycetota bacterium]
MSVEPIRRSVKVECGPEEAFRLFTEGMGEWWPIETHSRAATEHEGEGVKAERIEFQARAGGQILEHLSSGEVLAWADVLSWEPPHRFVVAWKPHSRPQPPTEVEVTFAAKEGGTIVELEHRGWERLTEDFAELYHSYAGGWIETLGRFATAAGESETQR